MDLPEYIRLVANRLEIEQAARNLPEVTRLIRLLCETLISTATELEQKGPR